ncbi:MAG: PIN domain-containing protein, partial [bacterium]|nr:PIN domain-containing protein [bacterium]
MIFVDTSFWVALRNRRDPHHTQAVGLLKKHADSRLVTTNHLRGETWTFLRRRMGHSSAVDFLNAVDRSERVTVLRVEDDLEEEALAWLRRRDEREYSFVDSTSFAMMRSREITQALAF